MGLIGERLHVLAFTQGSHENAVRAISLRPAEKHEVRFYYTLVTRIFVTKIRLDAKTVEHLRRSGPGWQTRVNALLGNLVAAGQI